MSPDIKFSHQSGAMVSTLCEGFQYTTALSPHAVALRTADGRTAITWREYARRVRSIAQGLSAIGVRRGDAVGIMLTNRPEFSLVDTATLHVGAAPFSIYNTSSPEQIAYLFANAGNKVVITEMALLPNVLAAGRAVEHVICVDGAADGTSTLAELESRTDAGFDFDATWRSVQQGDVAMLVYTSGTTGPPKGVEITHANVLAQVAALRQMFNIGLDDRIVSYLPAAHVADRVSGHYQNLLCGLQLNTITDPSAIASALPQVRPTVFFGVPRVWQ
jgi:long-subunit acyl-CoA synthetase (AMP-forming)